MDDWILDENHLVTDNTPKSIIPNFISQGMSNTIKLTFSVGDTTPRFTMSIEQEN